MSRKQMRIKTIHSLFVSSNFAIHGVGEQRGPESCGLEGKSLGQFSTFQRAKTKPVPKVIVEDGFERYDLDHRDDEEAAAAGSRKEHIARQISYGDRESRV